LIKNNALYSSEFKTWYFDSPNYTFSYENNDVVVKVPNTNIIGYVVGDSAFIYNTSGTYTLSNTSWNGIGGKVNWARAGMDANNIYATFNKYFIDMSKQEEKFKQEADLLKKSCKQEPKDVELIQDLMALQKTKTLMIRKRGLQSDIDNRLNQFIEELKNPEKG